jgi:FAD synthetase
MGTFDILHPGHLDYFRQAKEHGDYLIVVVARDSSAIAEGKKPRFGEKERHTRVASVSIVDTAVLGNEGDKLKIVEQEKPDMICLGYDQKVDEEKLKEALAKRGLTPKIVRANAYHPEKYKSSLMNASNNQ